MRRRTVSCKVGKIKEKKSHTRKQEKKKEKSCQRILEGMSARARVRCVYVRVHVCVRRTQVSIFCSFYLRVQYTHAKHIKLTIFIKIR